MQMQAGVLRSRESKRAASRADVIVAAAFIVVAGGVLWPTLGQARGIGRTVRCQDILGQLGAALQGYAAENQNWFPGENTTGVAVRRLQQSWGIYPSALAHASVPVQQQDWQTPLAPYTGVALPDNRAARWRTLENVFHCPQMMWNSVMYDTGGLVDQADFNAYPPTSWRGPDYLQPATFTRWGAAKPPPVLGYYAHPSIVVPIYPTAQPVHHVVTFEASYVPKLDRVGPAARKVFAADGTRYVGSASLLDIDVRPFVTGLGAFCSEGAWWSGENSYGVLLSSKNWDGAYVSNGSVSHGANLQFSYRHGTPASEQPLQPGALGSGALTPETGPLNAGSATLGLPGSVQGNFGFINAMCFDGHVERLSDRASRDIDRWYPTGSNVSQAAGLTNVPIGSTIP